MAHYIVLSVLAYGTASLLEMSRQVDAAFAGEKVTQKPKKHNLIHMSFSQSGLVDGDSESIWRDTLAVFPCLLSCFMAIYNS